MAGADGVGSLQTGALKVARASAPPQRNCALRCCSARCALHTAPPLLSTHFLLSSHTQGPPFPRPPDGAFLDDAVQQFACDVNRCLGDVSQCGARFCNAARRGLPRKRRDQARRMQSHLPVTLTGLRAHYPTSQRCTLSKRRRHRDRLPPAAALGRLLAARDGRRAAAAAPRGAGRARCG